MCISINEGWRIWRHSSAVKRSGWKRYPGDMKAICDGIINDCWDAEKGIYCASAGHFHQFYTRDFGIAVEALVAKRRDKCLATLAYAMQHFEQAEMVTVAITPSGRPFNFPTFSPDSLAFLLRALRMCKAKDLVKQYKAFLERQIKDWCAIVIADDGFVKRRVHFGGMRDHAVRSSSAYDNTMILVVKEEAKALGLATPPISLTPTLFVKEFWTGTHLKDDRDSDRLSGDANVVPFWLGVVKDAAKARTCLRALHAAGMDKPVPLAYSPSSDSAPPMIWQNLFAKNWESDARWLQLGLMYTVVAKRVDKALFRQAQSSLLANILVNKNILELFTAEGKPYTSAFYHADEGMLWGAALARTLL
jgi:hypothetical protein